MKNLLKQKNNGGNLKKIRVKDLFKNKKNVIIIVIVVIIISIFALLLVLSSARQNRIDEYTADIEAQYTEFQKLENREEQLAILASLIEDYEAYQKGEKIHEEITKEYEENISKMKEDLISYYDTVISENQIADVASATKEQLTTAKTNLTNLVTIIESEKDVVLTEEKYNEYTKQINDIIASYDAQIESIEKAEAEASAKAAAEAEAEAEAAAKAEQEDDQDEEQASQSSSSNSSDGSKPPDWNGYSAQAVGGRWCYGPWHSYTSFGEDGIEGTEDDSTSYGDEYGNHWDDEGNYWTDQDIWMSDTPPPYYPELVE